MSDLDLEAIRKDAKSLIYISDGTSGSDKVARLLHATPALLAEVESLRAKLAAVEAAYPGDEYLEAKPHKALDVAQAMIAVIRPSFPAI